MILEQLSNERAKQLESNTNDLIMHFEYLNKESMLLFHELFTWFIPYKLKAGELNSHVKKLTDIFQASPNYFVNYSNKNAVWAFKWNEEEFVFYKSVRGIAIQIPNSFSKDKLNNFVKELKQLLYSGK